MLTREDIQGSIEAGKGLIRERLEHLQKVDPNSQNLIGQLYAWQAILDSMNGELEGGSNEHQSNLEGSQAGGESEAPA